MKRIIAIAILVSLTGCGPGMRARSSQSRYESADSEIDAYFTDDETKKSSAGEQLELDLGDQDQVSKHAKASKKTTQNADQPELNFGNPVTATPDQEESKDESSSPINASIDDLTEAVVLKPTIYYLPTNEVAPFRSCGEQDVRSFKASPGQEMVPGKTEIKVCAKFYFAVQMEGSGLVQARDGNEYLVNYVGLQEGVPRFKVVDRKVCPYGLGKANLCLQPFISIAADRDRYNVGDVIYVPAVAKAKIRLPDGDIHRGFFIVTDTGGAINGPGRFDFFTGPLNELDKENPLRKIGLNSKANEGRLVYHLVKRDSKTQAQVLKYYKGRQIIPYRE